MIYCVWNIKKSLTNTTKEKWIISNAQTYAHHHMYAQWSNTVAVCFVWFDTNDDHLNERARMIMITVVIFFLSLFVVRRISAWCIDQMSLECMPVVISNEWLDNHTSDKTRSQKDIRFIKTDWCKLFYLRFTWNNVTRVFFTIVSES